jgi:hypothetical protein
MTTAFGRPELAEKEKSSMAKRRDWAFPFTVSALVGACEKRLAYHEERLAFWNAAAAAADADLRAHGIELRDYPVTGGQRVEAVLDPGRHSRYAECQGKQREHRARADEYRAYLVGLACAGTTDTYDLDADDIVWLGLADMGEEEAGHE